MKTSLFAAVVCAALAATAADTKSAKDQMVKIGGEGKVLVVNACGATAEALETAARKIGNLLMINISVENGAWSFPTAQKSFEATGANAAVFVVKDASLPISLVAMESRWGVVNADGLSDKSLEKEVLRVATVVLGGASSKYSASTMRPVFSREDLEKKAGDVVTFDSLMSIFTYLPDMGVKQYRMMSREDAIEEGLLKSDSAK